MARQPDTPPRLSRSSRPLRRVARWTAAGLLLIAVTAVAGASGLWWWAGQDGSLASALRLASRWIPEDALQLDDVSGALRGDGRVGRLVWQQDGLRVEADEVTLAWQPFGLLAGTLQIDRLGAREIRIDDSRPPSTEPSAAPASLALPIGVAVNALDVGRLRWLGTPAFEASQIRARYRFDGLRHRAELQNVAVARGVYQADVSLAARGTMALDARLTGTLETPVPGASTATTLTLDASARGPLAELAVQAQIAAEAPRTGRTPASSPHATLQAVLTPWAEQPLPHAQATFRELDLAAFWPGAPQTRLSGDGHVRPDTTHPQAWTLATTLDNDLPGPLDQNRLPVERLEGHGEWRGGVGLVRQLDARLAGGRLTASGEWTDAERLAWKAQAEATGIQPQRLHGALAALPFDARADAHGIGPAANFDLKARTNGAAPSGRDAVTVNARALRLREAAAQGRWADGLLALDTLMVRADDARLDASLRLRPAAPSGEGRLSLTAPGLKLAANGSAAATAGGGTLDLDLTDTAQMLSWLSRIPMVGDALRGFSARGQASLDLRWQGGWRDPAVQARVAAPSLEVRTDAEQAPWELRGAELNLDGRLADATLGLRARASHANQRVAVDLRAQGGLPGFNGTRALPWEAVATQAAQLRVNELSASYEDPALSPGTWRVALRGPATLRWQPQAGVLETSAGEATLTAPVSTASTAVAPVASAPAVIAWQPVRWRAGELVTAGRVSGLPMAWIELVAGQQMAGVGLTGTLVFDGTWDAVLADSLRLKASIARSSGDVTVRAEDGTGTATRVAAGVRTARLDLDNDGEQLKLALRWNSERAGTAEGQLATRLANGPEGWTWPADAALSGFLRAQLPRIGVWSVLAPPGWRLRGSLGADVRFSGTRAAPSLQGTLQADDLALRSVVDGIEFADGRLRAQLEGTRMRITEFTLQGAGDKGAGGQLTATGEAGWIDGRAQARLQAQVKQLRASIRTDRQLTVSGDVTAELAGRDASLSGKLTVDQANILLPDESKPELGNDVIVRSGGAAAAGAKAPEKTTTDAPAEQQKNGKLSLQVALDLGRNFRIQGRGIDTRVQGELELTGTSFASPQLNGTLRTLGGQYRAYGQRLDVDRGILRFTGAVDNPSLDILALRANMLSDQKVGVQITGTALLPRVRLYASPDMSDAEKLSWLVLGRSSASGGAEAALLQQAALALLGSRNGAMSGGLASALGLDELSVRGSSTSESGQTVEGAITLGKRFSRNFYAAYERSLSGALGSLFIFYDLSRRFTLRAQTGDTSAVDLIYTLSYD